MPLISPCRFVHGFVRVMFLYPSQELSNSNDMLIPAEVNLHVAVSERPIKKEVRLV